MKLALDPQMFYATSSVFELPDIVASLGYDWMELSPKADFIPFFRYPRVDDAGVRRLKKIARDAGVGIASVLPLQRWAGPDEDQRQAAVRSWKRIIQITVDLGAEICPPEGGAWPIVARHEMRLWFAVVRSGTPTPTDSHDELRWLTANQLFDIAWLPADLAIITDLRSRLERNRDVIGRS